MSFPRWQFNRPLITFRKLINVQLRNSKMATLDTLHFDNLALRALPLDQEEENFVRQVSLSVLQLSV